MHEIVAPVAPISLLAPPLRANSTAPKAGALSVTTFAATSIRAARAVEFESIGPGPVGALTDSSRARPVETWR
jgi:hypothetical protein